MEEGWMGVQTNIGEGGEGDQRGEAAVRLQNK